MTLLSEASFLVTPNGYKEDKLYAAIPTNGNGDMTVTRATTATRVDENDLVSSVASNVPRIDYTGGGCPSILLEPQRTNIVLRSEDFANASWVKIASSTVVLDATVANPTGILSTYKYTASNLSYGGILRQSVTITTATTYTFSFFVKKGNHSFVGIRFNTANNGDRDITYNFDTDTINQQGVTATAVASRELFANGWVRFILVYTSTTSGVTRFDIAITDSSGNTATALTGTEYIYVYGAQLEAGAYPTSYIPTTTSTVTRNADVINRDDIYTNNLIVGGGGTWFVHLINNTAFTNDANGNLFLDTASGGITNGINIRSIGTVARLYINFYTSGVSTFQYLTTTDTVKLAIKWNGATADVFENGAKVVSATIFATTAMEHLGGNGSDQPKYIKQMALFAKPLTDAQCIALTTL
jgi:hypothetical protein